MEPRNPLMIRLIDGAMKRSNGTGIRAIFLRNQRQHKTRLIMRAECADRRVDMTGVIQPGKYRHVEGADTPVLTLEPATVTELIAPLSFIGGNECPSQ